MTKVVGECGSMVITNPAVSDIPRRPNFQPGPHRQILVHTQTHTHTRLLFFFSLSNKKDLYISKGTAILLAPNLYGRVSHFLFSVWATRLVVWKSWTHSKQRPRIVGDKSFKSFLFFVEKTFSFVGETTHKKQAFHHQERYGLFQEGKQFSWRFKQEK